MGEWIAAAYSKTLKSIGKVVCETKDTITNQFPRQTRRRLLPTKKGGPGSREGSDLLTERACRKQRGWAVSCGK